MDNVSQNVSNTIYNIGLLYKKLDNYVVENNRIVHIDNLESSFSDLCDERYILDNSFMSKILSTLNEKEIIKKFRNYYTTLGISFKTSHKIPITIQTEKLLVTYERNLLIPKTPKDAQQLKDYNGKRGMFPLDIALGVSELPHNMTVRAMLKVSKVAQQESSYKKASEILTDDHGIKLDPVTIMKVTNHIGSLVFRNEMAKADECYNTLVSGKMTFPEKKKDAVLYIEMDGAFLNTREKSKTSDSSFHENKLGLVFSSDNKRIIQKRDKNANNRNILNGVERKKYEITQKLYTAYVGSVDTFKKLMFSCAVRGGYGSYKETVLISDGATWIRTLKDELFYDAQQILDFYHLCEKVSSLGSRYFKIDSGTNSHGRSQNQDNSVPKDHPNYPMYQAWYDQTCQKLLTSRIREVLEDIIKKEDELHIIKSKLSKYILNNIESVNYEAYLKKGYEIGSGGVESGNKSVLKERLDGPGMRWHIASAQSMVTLRAKMKSGRWYEDVVLPVRKHYSI